MATTLRCMSANVWHSGVWTPERTPQNRIPALSEAITAQAPHLLGVHQASLVNDRARRVSDRRQAPGAVRAEAALVFGDVNQPGLHHPAAPPDPSPQELPACNLAHRFTGMPGQEVVNRDVAELFARCRWTDLALHLADQTTDPGEQARLMAPTAHNGGFSIGRVYLTESLVPAAQPLKQADIPSDHRALVWDLDPTRIDPTLTTRLHV